VITLGVKPFPATADAIPAPEPSDSGVPIPLARFGMAHALVLSVCVVTAAVLAKTGMPVRDVFLLLSGSISVGAVAVVAVVTGGRVGSRIERFKDAYRNSAR
jgi:hypothetical protein